LFTSDEDIPVWAKLLYTLTFVGNKPFAIMPFIVAAENGETVPSTDSNSSEPVLATKASISGGSFVIGFGDVYEASRKMEAAVIYRTDITVDLTGWANRYADYYRAKLEAEEEGSAKVLIFGITCFGIASTTITNDAAIFSAYFQHPADKLMRLQGA
jgi:hypothetical protein